MRSYPLRLNFVLAGRAGVARQCDAYKYTRNFMARLLQ
jgi:hypothetical protein